MKTHGWKGLVAALRGAPTMSAVLERVFVERQSKTRELALQAGVELHAVRAELERSLLELERDAHKVPDPKAVVKRGILQYMDMWMVTEIIDDVAGGDAEDMALAQDMVRLLAGHVSYVKQPSAWLVGSLGSDVLRRFFIGTFGARGFEEWRDEYRYKIFQRTGWLQRALSVQKDLRVPDEAIITHWRRMEESDHASAMKAAKLQEKSTRGKD